MKFYIRLGNQANSNYIKETKNSGISHIPDIADAKVFPSPGEAKKWISDRITAQWVSSYVVMSDEQIRNQHAAAALGSIKSPKKAASSRESGEKGGRPKIEKIAINIHRPFHNTAYDARIFVPKNNLSLSGDQYRKIYLHHKNQSDCQCSVEITDDSGKFYGVMPSDRDNNKYYLFEV